MTLQDLEAALDSGQLQVQMANDRWWTLRRNGRTRTWTSRPNDYRIPVKAGLRAYGQLSPKSGLTLRIVAASQPEA